MKTLLSLDLSTTCTGWSTFDIQTKTLTSYGTIKPGSKFNGVSISKLKYPQAQLFKMIDLSLKVRQLILECKPSMIVIEEIAGSKNRLGQKVLDSYHFVLLYHIQEFIQIISFYDVTGCDGWRFHLGLKLSDADKINNKEAKKLNSKLAKGTPKLPIIGPKDLACRYVNEKFKLNLDAQTNQFDADIADSVSMGDSYLRFKCPKV